MNKKNKYFREIPSIDEILNHSVVSGRLKELSKSSSIRLINISIEETKEAILNGEIFNVKKQIYINIDNLLKSIENQNPKVVINGTGVILHTNLGRSPISKKAVESSNEISLNYSSLEISTSDGKRENRNIAISKYLSLATGCEKGFIVNNNASATLLTLATITNQYKDEIIISRGEAVEIGGGFRIPDIMKISGAKLVEVGTTNKTYPNDYLEAITPRTAGILKVHTSNFIVKGFVHSPNISDLVKISTSNNIPLINDIGSGCLIDTSKYNLPKEPLVQDSIALGVDVTLFSGDKLLGGAQAGIITGKKDIISKIESHSLARAFRSDKVSLISTISTLRSYIKDSYEEDIPIWKMISQNINKITKRAEKICSETKIGEIIDGESLIGGGSMPDVKIPTKIIKIDTTTNENTLKKKLLQSDPIILARVYEGSILIDIRTVLEEQDKTLLKIIKNISK
tara:strand:+ start:17782 stop:19152 length:1371 start_codon:yes stop_codon:yes gene_type:complete